MNSLPDRAKDCLPPKKRESRQGSSEQRPPDEFKSPAPIRTRPVGGRQAEPRGPPNGPVSNSHYGKVLPHAPPTDKFVTPWPPSPMPYHLFTNQPGDRCVPKPALWRDQCAPGMDLMDTGLHHPRWQNSELPLALPHPSASISYKTHHPSVSREMWTYCNADKLSFKHHLSRHTPHMEHHLDGRRGYMFRKHNGLDTMDSRMVVRPSAAGSFSYDGKVRQDSSQANGKRRYQEDHRPLGRALAKDGRASEGPSGHSSPQERDPCVIPKASTNALDKSAFSALPLRAPSLDSFSLADPPGEAHIYYASLLQSPLAHPLQGSLGTASIVPFYSPHAGEPHALRSSRLSPLVENQSLEVFHPSPYNSHGSNSHGSDRGQLHLGPSCPRSSSGGHRSHTDPVALQCAASRSSAAPQPVAFLPHFAKGSLIELSGGQLRRVEDLKTEDFVLCANTSPEFHLCYCTILLISPCAMDTGFFNLQVLLADRNTQESLKVLAEYPFFVRGRGWSSCCPQRTAQLYGLQCHQLSIDDVCLALTPVPLAPTSTSPASVPGAAAGIAAQRTPTKEGAKTGQRRPVTTEPPPPDPEPSPNPTQPPRDPGPSRKRHCSAPELLSGGSPLYLPTVSKHRGQQ